MGQHEPVNWYPDGLDVKALERERLGLAERLVVPRPNAQVLSKIAHG